MAVMRDKWTDERLDDMNARMGEGFGRVDREIRDLRLQMTSRFEATQRLIVQVGGGMFVTMVVGFLGVITQL